MAGGPVCSPYALAAALRALDRNPARIAAADWPSDFTDINQAGLYSWWVDISGGEHLSDGLGLPLAAGRIYAGQTGATMWPSGTPSGMSLDQRVDGLHLSGKIRGSTFRLSLASILAEPLGLEVVGETKLAAASEETLSHWMTAHLAVAIFPFDDRDSLEDLETKVLGTLDPPFNLDKMAKTPVRTRLSSLRRQLAHPETVAAAPALPTTGPKRPSAVKASVQTEAITLHFEMAEILRERDNAWMSSKDLAALVNTRGRYIKKHGSSPTVSDWQIRARARKYPQLFERDGSRVRLRDS